MSDDLIRRSDVVKMLENAWGYEGIEEDVNEIPTAYDVGWIPASERLPDIGKEVLVTYQNGDIAVDFIHSDCGWFWEDKEEAGEVIAWRPLPKPYKEVKQE